MSCALRAAHCALLPWVLHTHQGARVARASREIDYARSHHRLGRFESYDPSIPLSDAGFLGSLWFLTLDAGEGISRVVGTYRNHMEPNNPEVGPWRPVCRLGRDRLRYPLGLDHQDRSLGAGAPRHAAQREVRDAGGLTGVHPRNGRSPRGRPQRPKRRTAGQARAIRSCSASLVRRDGDGAVYGSNSAATVARAPAETISGRFQGAKPLLAQLYLLMLTCREAVLGNWGGADEFTVHIDLCAGRCRFDPEYSTALRADGCGCRAARCGRDERRPSSV